MKILFVCKNNRFRSKIAEAYFNKTNKNKKIMAESAGLFEGISMSKRTVKVVKRLGIIMKGKPRAMSTKLLLQQNLVVIMADDVPKLIFKNKPVKKLIRFQIKDVSENDEKGILKTTKKIIRKIDKLVEGLEARK